MEARAQTAIFTADTHGNNSSDASLPAGSGLALAVVVGSLVWMGIFALMM